MDVKELLKSLSEIRITPPDTRMVVVCGCKSENILGQIGNCNIEELTEILLGLYQQVDEWRIAMDAVQSLMLAERQRAIKAPINESESVNTFAQNTKAQAAIMDAIKELGGIYVGVKKDKS